MQPLRSPYRQKPITPEFKTAWRRLRQREMYIKDGTHFAPRYILTHIDIRWRISTLYVCAHRGDPFAKRAFAQVMTERMKL